MRLLDQNSENFAITIPLRDFNDIINALKFDTADFHVWSVGAISIPSKLQVATRHYTKT